MLRFSWPNLRRSRESRSQSLRWWHWVCALSLAEEYTEILPNIVRNELRIHQPELEKEIINERYPKDGINHHINPKGDAHQAFLEAPFFVNRE